jgi:orotidine-5'-phosphate decarboxylase
MDETFGERLRVRLLDAGPLCVGIDPSRDVVRAWEREDTVEGLEYVALTTLEATVGDAAVIKCQVAFFERFASGGLRVLERVISEAHAAGLIVIADAKRGDVGSTNEGYAQAWLEDESPLCVDALTLSPFLGVGALAPIFHRANATNRGLFVLVATSNPEGRTVQDARTAQHERVSSMVFREVAEHNAERDTLGNFGVVLGATREHPEFDLRSLQGPFLVPGVGAQGASASDVARLFEGCVDGSVAINVSRAISAAGPEPRAVRDALRRWRDELRSVL